MAKKAPFISVGSVQRHEFLRWNNAEDNSGVMEYVSIRHGELILEQAVINGLTLCGVGAKTKINN